MFIAIMESETRTWYALAKTESDAKEAIREKWNNEQYALVQNGWKNKPDTYSSVKKLEEDYDISVVEIQEDECIVI